MDEGAIAQLLERLGQLLRSEQAAQARRHGLQPVQAEILRYLARANRFSTGTVAVAEYLGLTRGTVSVSLHRLAERGLLARSAAAGDSRRVGWRLTAEGARLCAAIETPPVLAAALGALGPGEATDLEDRLRRLLRAMQRAHGGRAFGICRQCRHFRPADGGGGLCGLTGEALAAGEGGQLCRHWSEPAARRAG
ncbi:MAG: MarR family transcriptional regulator [Alphaproteobacteria bacterium]|nr:MAG: MarR family transcriptional regulator [Alphaproteobacteria bacterium]